MKIGWNVPDPPLGSTDSGFNFSRDRKILPKTPDSILREKTIDERRIVKGKLLSLIIFSERTLDTVNGSFNAGFGRIPPMTIRCFIRLFLHALIIFAVPCAFILEKIMSY